MRYLTAADRATPFTEAWPRTPSAQVINTQLGNDLIICNELGFAPLDDTAAQLLFRFVAAAC